METVYLICALSGGTLLVCQFLLTVLGLGGHHDFGGHDVHDFGGHDTHTGDHHADHAAEQDSVTAWFVSLLTFRTLVAALTFFGLAGMAGCSQWGERLTTLLVAIASGAAAMVAVGWLMRFMSGLRAEGTVRMDRALGKSGTVYLPIPGQKAGAGKVTLNLQNRTVEYQAITAQQSLPAGAPVVIVAVVNSDTVEVAPAQASSGV